MSKANSRLQNMTGGPKEEEKRYLPNSESMQSNATTTAPVKPKTNTGAKSQKATANGNRAATATLKIAINDTNVRLSKTESRLQSKIDNALNMLTKSLAEVEATKAEVEATKAEVEALKSRMLEVVEASKTEVNLMKLQALEEVEEVKSRMLAELDVQFRSKMLLLEAVESQTEASKVQTLREVGAWIEQQKVEMSSEIEARIDSKIESLVEIRIGELINRSEAGTQTRRRRNLRYEQEESLESEGELDFGAISPSINEISEYLGREFLPKKSNKGRLRIQNKLLYLLYREHEIKRRDVTQMLNRINRQNGKPEIRIFHEIANDNFNTHVLAYFTYKVDIEKRSKLSINDVKPLIFTVKTHKEWDIIDTLFAEWNS